MADNANRQSLITSLADRYKNQNIGGAYNANKAGTSTYHNDNPVSFKAQTVDNSGEFFVNQPIGISNFKGTEGQTYNEISEYGKGVGTSTYNALNLKSQKSIDFNKNSEFQLSINQQSPSNFKGIEHEFDSATIKEQSSLAQKIGTSTYAPDSKYISYNARTFAKTPNFVVKQPLKVTNFKGIDDNKSLRYNEISNLAQGFNNNKYKP